MEVQDRIGVARDAGDRYHQPITAGTPAYVTSDGNRMEDADVALQLPHGDVVVAVSDGHGSHKVAHGVHLGGRETADAAIAAVRGHAHLMFTAPEELFSKAQEHVRTTVSLAHLPYATFMPPTGSGEPAQLTVQHDGKVTPFYGSTLLVVALCGRTGEVTLANVGDSQAMFVPDEGEPGWLHEPHDKSNVAEDKRVRAMGAKDAKSRSRGGNSRRYVYTWTVRGTRLTDEFAMSRSLGHFGNPFISQSPDVRTVTLPPGTVVVATDGVWDYVDVADVPRACRAGNERGTMQVAADAIIEMVRRSTKHKKRDNATVVCLRVSASPTTPHPRLLSTSEGDGGSSDESEIGELDADPPVEANLSVGAESKPGVPPRRPQRVDVGCACAIM